MLSYFLIATAICIFTMQSALALERGVVVYENGDCIVIETALGLVLAESYGGSVLEGQQVVGELNMYGFKEVFILPSGSKLSVYIDDFWVDENEAYEWLAENDCL